ncbi:fasciclin domain-containing protein [Stappia taiwanensis]|uniref:Fasciclin domain-containing protein n=1 Tax=Stappia taiwanensis TaxID=992267 RepID=A0A838Y0N5_9HYPH|nr:fasciclin domain-containing protein [Stappia taiwanensis]MBA4612530.1 fasciclin domain-containing protein [Stappia taiwanensis]GGF06060.1 fasciclin [Stappia taiwanensis]
MTVSLKTLARNTLAGTLLAAVLPVGAATLAAADAQMSASKTIVERAAASSDHTTLVAAVKAAGLVETLSGSGPFTVFAPTNDAFGKLPDGTVDTLLKPENKAQLTKILTCHVVAAEAMSTAIAKLIADGGGSHPVETVGGCVFTAKSEGGKIMLEDGQGNTATVTVADLDQSNGVIHVIDTVLLPAS